MNGFLHIARDWILRWLLNEGGSGDKYDLCNNQLYQ